MAIVGAGRTDTGVNARRMYAHFDAPEITDKGKFLLSLNRLCGPAVALEDLIRVPDDAHARFDATEREYRYFVSFGKSPFLSPVSWHSPSALDTEAMNRAAALLRETEDFTSFAKLHSDARTNICDLREARWDDWIMDIRVFYVPEEQSLRGHRCSRRASVAGIYYIFKIIQREFASSHINQCADERSTTGSTAWTKHLKGRISALSVK